MNWQPPTGPAKLALESAAPEGPGSPPGPERLEGQDGLSIGELSARADLSPRTVRYYEELGLLPNVRRRAGGRRVYGADELERLRFIRRLKALGLSLAEIRDLNAVHAIAGSTEALLERLGGLLALRQAELEARIGELAGLRDEISRYRAHVAGRIERLRRGHRRNA